MPKATRKKKLKKQDFAKAKLKVGKTIAPAGNQTQVAFKTQAIHVPTQAVVQHSLEEASVNAPAKSPDESNPKNKKNQTITELISLLKHHNWHHRKDAMTEITMLLHAHPKALNRIQGSLLETMASLFLDDESPVRKACLAFLSSVLSLIDEKSIRPFISMMMAYIGSALSHIQEPIRLDALKFVNVFLDTYPSAMRLFAGQILPSCIALLDSKTSHGKTTIVNPKSQIGSTKSRMDVLESIYKLFQVSCLLPTEKFWFLKGQNGAESVPRSLHYADHWLPPKEQAALQFNPFSSKGATNRKELGSSEFYSMSKLEKTAPVAGHSRDTQGLDLISYVDRLLPTLLDFWIEASPLVFGGEVIDASPSLALLQGCMRMINYLNCASLHAKTYRTQITKYISPEFPFGSPKRFSYRDGKIALVLQEMNSQYCEMACHLYDAGDKGSEWLTPLLDYLALSLTPTQQKMEQSMSVEQLENMYPVIWTLVNDFQTAASSRLFVQCLKFKSIDRSNASFKSIFGFLSRLIQAQQDATYKGRFKLEEAEQEATLDWILMLPRKIWEIKASDSELTGDVLDFLRFVFQRNLLNITQNEKFLDKMQLSMVPFFHSTTSKGEFFGPFLMLPHEVQTKALDILYYVPSWSDKLVKSIVTSMNNLATSPLILAHFLDICALRQIDAKTALDISLYSSILCTLVLIGYGANEIEVLSQKELSSTSRCYRIKDGLQMKMNNFGKAIKGSKFEWTPEVYWEWRMKKLDNWAYHSGPVKDVIMDVIFHFLSNPLPLDSVVIILLALFTAVKESQETLETLTENEDRLTTMASLMSCLWNDEEFNEIVDGPAKDGLMELINFCPALHSKLPESLQLLLSEKLKAT